MEEAKKFPGFDRKDDGVKAEFGNLIDESFQSVLDDKFCETSDLERKGYSLVNELQSPQKELLQDYLRHIWIQESNYKTLVADLKMGKIPPFLKPFIVAAS